LRQFNAQKHAINGKKSKVNKKYGKSQKNAYKPKDKAKSYENITKKDKIKTPAGKPASVNIFTCLILLQYQRTTKGI
jgi:hypothetical protein